MTEPLFPARLEEIRQRSMTAMTRWAAILTAEDDEAFAAEVLADLAILVEEVERLMAQLAEAVKESDSQKLRGDTHFKCQIQAELRADRAEAELVAVQQERDECKDAWQTRPGEDF